jgi:hypothetical protein
MAAILNGVIQCPLVGSARLDKAPGVDSGAGLGLLSRTVFRGDSGRNQAGGIFISTHYGQQSSEFQRLRWGPFQVLLITVIEALALGKDWSGIGKPKKLQSFSHPSPLVIFIRRNRSPESFAKRWRTASLWPR